MPETDNTEEAPPRDMWREDANPQADWFYKMDHCNRGLAVLFNIEHFDKSSVNSLERANARDENSLKTTFQWLGFQTVVYKDLTKAAIENTLSDISKRDLSGSDCFVLAFMSQGRQGKLQAQDGTFEINNLWQHFTAEECPSLKNKPKLFFIQARQGGSAAVHAEEGSGGNQEAEDPEAQGSNNRISCRIPNRADFLVAVATVTENLSNSEALVVPSFIHELCTKLKRDGFNMDICSILTYVNKRLNDPCNRGHQMIFISTLLRSLKFSRKPAQNAPSKKTPNMGEDEMGLKKTLK